MPLFHLEYRFCKYITRRIEYDQASKFQLVLMISTDRVPPLYYLDDLVSPYPRVSINRGQVVRLACRLAKVSFPREDKLWEIYREKSAATSDKKRKITKIEYASASFNIRPLDMSIRTTMGLHVPNEALTSIFGGIPASLLVHESLSMKLRHTSLGASCEEDCKLIIRGLKQSALNQEPFIMTIAFGGFSFQRPCAGSHRFLGTLLALSRFN